MTLKEEYDLNGYIGPIRLMSKDDALELRDLVLKLENDLHLMNSDYRCKSNVLFPFVDRISRHPKLVEIFTELIGPNIHCWDSLFWIKKPGDGRDVSFHQDATYWNFNNRHMAATAWFAFDDVTEEHGGIEYIKGSHKAFLHRHKDVKTDTNLLMRGQTVDMEIPKERVKTTVPAGCVLIHSPFIIHGSSANVAKTPRVSVGMILASTECKPVLTISPESTVMVSGVDTYNYMMHDPQPTGVWDFDIKNWQAAYDRQHLNYYKMEQRNDI